MLTLTHHPAKTLLGTDEYEATYWLGTCDWASCVRSCLLEACADALHNAVMWLGSKYLPRGAKS